MDRGRGHKKPRRNPSASSRSSRSARSGSPARSLVSCSTCSGYYSRSSSPAPDRTPSPGPSRSASGSRGSPHTRPPRPTCRSLPRSEVLRVGGLFKRAASSRPGAEAPFRDPRPSSYAVPRELRPVLLSMDKDWVYGDLPTFLLADKLALSVRSKAQLLGIIEGQISAETAKAILDIELVQRPPDCFASIRFASGEACYRALQDHRPALQALGWAVQLDRQQRLFLGRTRELDSRTHRLEAPRPAARDRERAREHERAREARPPADRPGADCDPRVRCLLVDYEFFSDRHSSAELADVFRKWHALGAARKRSCWHVHFASEAAVDRAHADRHVFEARGRRLRPYLAQAPRAAAKEEPRRAADELDTIRALIMERTAAHARADVRILEPVSSADMDDKLANLPIFNRKYLEKLQEIANADESDGAEPEDTPPPAPRARQQTIQATAGLQPSALPGTPEARAHAGQPDGSSPTPSGSSPFPGGGSPFPSGAARLEGHFRQSPAQKRVWFQPIIPPGEEERPAAAPAKGRSSRAAGRRHESTMAEIAGRMSALHLRQKRVILGRSSIHSYGLFAGEDIEPGELVIEYVGEVIRHSLANIRERRLEEQLRAAGSQEMASSYFFRLDLVHVVDATLIGNLARFVNHSCDPNCTAKVVQLEGTAHIVFYARKPIGRGDEITYDYKFNLEADPAKKIACLCGMPACRKYLN